MTQESPRPFAHPDPETLAAHAEHRLKADEAARVDAHVAGCQDCFETYTETLRFLDDDKEGAGVEPVAVHAPARRRAFVFAGLAAAAALVVGLGVFVLRGRAPSLPSPLVAPLVQAIGETRMIEPRLTGGFQYGRLIVLRSGEAAKGLDAQPPAVLAAVATIRARAENDTSPEALQALAATYLVSGDVAAAVQALESATAQKPDDPRLQSDLAAAYLVRAARTDEPADIPRALESAERAIALKDPPTEAWFNRALALERLHLTDAAKKAWQDYLDRDATSGWADEARQHLETLRSVHQTSAEEESARARAAVESGQEAIDRLANDSPSSLRAYFEDEILPAWADAHLVGHPDEEHYREQARVIGEALLGSTADRLPRDAAIALAAPATTTPSDPLRSQAAGYQQLREAKRRYDLQEPACTQYQATVRSLAAGGSPYVLKARLQSVATCQLVSDQAAAIAELHGLEASAAKDGYTQSLGRALWLRGLVHAYRGELTESLEEYRSARSAYRKTRDADGEMAMSALAAEALLLQGEIREAWKDRERTLAMLSQASNPWRRHNALAEAAWACLDERMPRTALHLQAASVEAAVASSLPLLITEAFTRRATTRHALGADQAAAEDLAEAGRWVGRIADPTYAARWAAENQAVTGELLRTARPEEAAQALGHALDYFKSAEPARLPALHLLRARAQIAGGFDEAGEQELEAGIQALERGRLSLREASGQLSFFDQALPFFDEMVRLQVAKHHDVERALAYVERGHARQVADALAGASAEPLSPDAIRRALPAGIALVYYLPLDDRVFMWSVSREGCHFIERPRSASELSRLVAANQAAIEGRAPLDVVRTTGARLHDELVHPFIPFIASARALVFIPDGVLQSVSFAALWNPETSRYLIEDHLVGVAPSGTVFLQASNRAGGGAGTPTALVVGNPTVDRRHRAELPDLPGAEAEAIEIARLYPGAELLTGKSATRSAFLRMARGRRVVHFAGHAVSNSDSPAMARLVFAPEGTAADSGTLQLQKLDRNSFPETRVVVLAACRTAGGPISRVEGVLNIGRPFLAAGVPSVVVSLWDIEDALSRRFFVSFHQAVLAGEDSLSELRKAQVAFVHSGDSFTAHPASWASFISIGGTNLHSLSKGESS